VFFRKKTTVPPGAESLFGTKRGGGPVISRRTDPAGCSTVNSVVEARTGVGEAPTDDGVLGLGLGALAVEPGSVADGDVAAVAEPTAEGATAAEVHAPTSSPAPSTIPTRVSPVL
jgi:hypothetical protein